MKSAKSSNRFKSLLVIASAAKQSSKRLWIAASGCALLAMTMMSVSVYAQDSTYAPPDMFGDMTPPMVRPEPNKDGYIVEPKASANTQLPPDGNVKPVITPRVSVDPDSGRVPAPQPQPAPAPQLVLPQAPAAPVIPSAPPSVQPPKMMQPIIEKPAIKREKPAAKPRAEKTKTVKPPVPPAKPVTPEPAKAPETPPKQVQPAVPAAPSAAMPPAPAPAVPSTTPAPVPRDPNESAITGPKTMPALPAENVDKQVTFEDKTPPAVDNKTIMERHLDEVETHKQPVPPAPKPNVAPVAFDPGNEGALKKSIPFQPGQIGLSSAEIDPIVAGVNKELDGEGKKDWRVQIRAYATPYGTGVSSDRRIALSRALSLRTAMIAQGVSANRIDVLAEGQQDGDAKSGDRIDLYLYGPAAD